MGYLCPCFTPKSEWWTVGVVQVLSHSLLLANFDHAETEDYTTGEDNVGLRHLAVFHDTCTPQQGDLLTSRWSVRGLKRRNGKVIVYLTLLYKI